MDEKEPLLELKRKVSKKFLKRVKTDKRYQKFLALITEYGMGPCNAAIKAGFPYDQAMKVATIKAGEKMLTNMTVRDIAEQEFFTIRGAIRKMAQKAGFVPGVDPAQRTISANVIVKSDDPTVRIKDADSLTKDFIDVPDERVIFKYIQELLELTGYKKKKENGDLNGSEMPDYTIIFNVHGNAHIDVKANNAGT